MLADADVGVLPSRIEGLSNTLLEFMASGLPALASRVSGSEDFVVPGRNGWLFPVADVAALAAALREAEALPPERLAAMGRQARADVEATASLDVVVGAAAGALRRRAPARPRRRLGHVRDRRHRRRPGGALPDEAVARAMNAAITHRGPDDEGIYRDDQAMLGMRRLSIIDLAGGHQPVHNEDGTVQAVFNGEIYNFRELRAELEARGHRFYTRSDTEVIVHGYEEWGDDAFARLDGMFGIALWDTRTRALILARDRFGEKPLFYSLQAGADGEAGGRLLFASELKSLLAVPGFKREIDPEAVRAYVCFGYVPTPGSIFRGVHKLPPGHSLRFVDGTARAAALLPPRARAQAQARRARGRGAAGRLLDEAVKSRLVSDVPFGAFLSGGLDSSVVVALMSRHLQQPVRTFSIGFREADYNELSDARRVASHLETEHHELVVEPDAVELLQQLVWYLDEPFADSSAVPTYLVAKLARQHVKMVLTGDGGDEAFAGYDRYLRFLALERAGPLRPAGGRRGEVRRAIRSRVAWLSPAAHRRAAPTAVPGQLPFRRGADPRRRRGSHSGRRRPRRRRRALRRARRSGASVLVSSPSRSLRLDRLRQLSARRHPGQARPHGDGQLARRARAVPEPSTGRVRGPTPAMRCVSATDAASTCSAARRRAGSRPRC